MTTPAWGLTMLRNSKTIQVLILSSQSAHTESEGTMSALVNESVPNSNQSMKITKMKEHIGAEVTGIDLREPIDAETHQRMNDALVEHVALVIRDQVLEPADFQNAISRFGEIMEGNNSLYELVEGFPLMFLLSNRLKDSKGAPAKVEKNANWHTDNTNHERPPKYTTLYAVELPDTGTITSVVNMRAAYEALSPEWKDRIDPLQTANTLISRANWETGNPDIVKKQKETTTPAMMHPLVRTHPENGTKAIWFHKSKTDTVTGMDPYETQDFLAELLANSLQDDFIYVHEWKLGDLLIVDNRSGLHRADVNYDHSQHRMLYRLMVKGDRPV
jgi:taurine dioxygenase